METAFDPHEFAKRRRIFVVDPFAISRMAVSQWIGQTPDLKVCGQADSEAAALAAVERLKPDAVVTEVLRPKDLGFIRSLHQRHPHLPILVYSYKGKACNAALAVKAGADGYLMKDAGRVQLVNCVRAAFLFLAPIVKPGYQVKF